jgi:hypothetical protein
MDNRPKRPTTTPPKPRTTRPEAPPVVDPHWTWAERAGRAEESPAGTLGVEATARLKLLQRAAVNFAARLPSIEQWANFLRVEIIPVYNAVMPDERMCLECAKRMPNKKATTHVCSPECASSFAARTRRPGTRAGAVSIQPHSPGETAKITLRELAPTKKPK